MSVWYKGIEKLLRRSRTMVDDSYLHDFLSGWDLVVINVRTKDKVDAYDKLKFHKWVEFIEIGIRDILLDRHYNNPTRRNEKEGFEYQADRAKAQGWRLTDDEIEYLQA